MDSLFGQNGEAAEYAPRWFCPLLPEFRSSADLEAVVEAQFSSKKWVAPAGRDFKAKDFSRILVTPGGCDPLSLIRTTEPDDKRLAEPAANSQQDGWGSQTGMLDNLASMR